ncbi:MAG: HNH endonuclease [Methylococcaceae bacterium]|nr:HNH endonuclease [Methylococcaceae bacterium]
MEIDRLQVLRTDASGMPLEWIGYQEAAKLYYLEQVAYACGSRICTLHGGINAKSGVRSLLDINSILATYSHSGGYKVNQDYLPPLSNQALFRRDNHLCLYCGVRFANGELSRDHITPLSQGGEDIWNNVVTACKRCNNHKAGRTPEQAGIQLLAIPFIPTHAEYVYLQGRRILSDQMEFLKAHFPRKSPLHQRIS